MKKRLISTLCALVLVVACPLTALATRADVNSAGAISSDKETGVTVYQDAAGGIVLSNLPVPQKMMPSSVIIYDDQLQAKVIQGGYVKDDFTPISDTRTTILRGLEAVTITADMSPDERATAEWENRLVNGFKAQILKNGIQAAQPYSPTIYPGMKVVYDENDGDINNIYYPDPKEPSGYSIHNVPVNNNDSTATTLTATPVLGLSLYTHLRAHETRHDLVCRLLLEKKKQH